MSSLIHELKQPEKAKVEEALKLAPRGLFSRVYLTKLLLKKIT
jgi:hypothetical protein